MASPARRARVDHDSESYRQLADGGRAFGGPEPAIVEEREHDGVLYRLEHVRCGKRGCWCSAEYPRRGHGPYWYAYWREDDRRRSAYIGKRYMSLAASRAAKARKLLEAEKRRRDAAASRKAGVSAKLQAPDLELARAWDGRRMDRTTARRILGVRSEDAAVVRAAYRAIATSHHPDRARSERQRERNERIMKAANTARRTLLGS